MIEHAARLATIDGVDIRLSGDPVPYAPAVAAMEARAEGIAARTAAECIWLLEHPPVITGGTSARSSDLLAPDAVPVVATGRGGQYTFHAPGQRVVYVMLDLGRRGRDVRRLVRGIEAWVAAAIGRLGVVAASGPLGTGLWVGAPGRERKVAAIGIRVRRWVTLHGAAINVTTDLSGYDLIVPCGIRDRGVTRLIDLEQDVTLARLDQALVHEAAAFLAGLSPGRDQPCNALEAAGDCG